MDADPARERRRRATTRFARQRLGRRPFDLVELFAGLLFCFLRPRALVAICAALLVSYWALVNFVPIRDIQLTKASLAQLAESRGEAATAALFRAEGNPSAAKHSPAWAAAEAMFYATTNRDRGKYDPGYNLADHLDFQFLSGRKYDRSSTRKVT